MPQRHGRLRLRTPRSPSSGRVVLCLLSVFCFLLILRNSDVAISYMGRGLTLCVNTVIPSLFPFMVISELLVGSGAGEALGRILSKPMQWLFGASGAGSSAVVLGTLCGSPVGASTAVSLYDHNLISKRECEHLLTFVSNPSSAFLITAVGVSMYGNRRLGVLLYGVVLGCGLLMGILSRFFMSGKRGRLRHVHPHYPMGFHPDGTAGRGEPSPETGGITVITGAVSHAAVNMLTVCAYVVFFSTLMGVFVTGVMEKLPFLHGQVGDILRPLLCGLLEISCGVSEAAEIASSESFSVRGPEISLVLTAAVAGWSGFSVHCQIMTLCGGRGLSFRPYLLAKAAQGFLCGAVTMLILALIDPAWLTPATDTVVGAILDVTAGLRLPALPRVLSHIGLVAGGALYVREKRR